MTTPKLIPSLTITDITEDGRGIGRHNNQVIFVKHTVPGDVVNANVYRHKKKYAEAELSELLTPSIHRTVPFCQHFGICGGCKWQHLNYEQQLAFKQKQVYDALTRLANIENPAIADIKASATTKYYRNKLEFSFSNREWMTLEQISNPDFVNTPALGFHIPQHFDKILNINECFLQPTLQNNIRNFIKDIAIKENLEFFNPKSQEGFLRNIVFRNTLAGEWMLVLIVKENNIAAIENILNKTIEAFKELTSVYYIVNEKRNDSFADLTPVLFSGNAHITEKLDALEFKIGPKTFFQTNTTQALELYRITKKFAALTGNEVVYDLYTGTGTIALYLAQNCKHITGVDYIPESIEAAHENAANNSIANATFYAGDIKNVFNAELISKHGNADVIITDPPRAGMHEDVVKTIIESNAARLVYVSCNPATQARDIKLLSTHYSFIKSQPVDMFPQTSHVENVVLLQKN